MLVVVMSHRYYNALQIHLGDYYMVQKVYITVEGQAL